MQSFAPNVRTSHGKPQRSTWADGSSAVTGVTQVGSKSSPETPPAVCLSQRYQWFHSENTDIQIYIYITCSSLVPIPHPKMLRVFNFIWTTTKSCCIPQGAMVPRNSKASGHCQQERKFKLMVNFGITADGFQPWQTFKLLWQPICHWKTSKNLLREKRWSFTLDTGVGIKRRRFFPLPQGASELVPAIFKSFNSPSIP